jgi:demethylmenaquinone methyltransferase/2-methoxy-6-polyprenyl-1,4-benzoquinol methylase
MTQRKMYFNRLAETWDENYRTNELLTFLENFVPKFGLKLGERILDVGTGTGILIPFLLNAIGLSGHITAIDFAENMVKICSRKYAHFPNISISRQQVEELDLPSESFDAVVCFGVLPHLADRERALFQINRVLRNGGRLIIAHALSSQEIREHHYGASSAVAADKLPTPEEMKKLLKRHGFARIRFVDKPGEYLDMSFKLPTQVETADK